jgi:hypothetical protein
MNTSSPLVTRCKSFFRQNPVRSVQSRPFEDFPALIRTSVLSNVCLDPDEEPSIACVLGSNAWTLLTSHRLIWCNDMRPLSLAWSSIREAIPNDEELIRAHSTNVRKPEPGYAEMGVGQSGSFLDDRKSFLASASWLLKRDKLIVTTTNGNVFQIQLEPVGFSEFWHAVDVMLVANQKGRTNPERGADDKSQGVAGRAEADEGGPREGGRGDIH